MENNGGTSIGDGYTCPKCGGYIFFNQPHICPFPNPIPYQQPFPINQTFSTCSCWQLISVLERIEKLLSELLKEKGDRNG